MPADEVVHSTSAAAAAGVKPLQVKTTAAFQQRSDARDEQLKTQQLQSGDDGVRLRSVAAVSASDGNKSPAAGDTQV